jgi:hypothetical protein
MRLTMVLYALLVQRYIIVMSPADVPVVLSSCINVYKLKNINFEGEWEINGHI